MSFIRNLPGGGGSAGFDPPIDNVSLDASPFWPSFGLAALQPGATQGFFTCMGIVRQSIVVDYIRFRVGGTLGVGTQAAEVGLFSTPNPPTFTAQTLTKLVADGTLDDLTANASVIKGNVSPLAFAVPTGTILWAGIRLAMSVTIPSVFCASTSSLGNFLLAVTPGPLTALTTVAGVVSTSGIAGVAFQLVLAT